MGVAVHLLGRFGNNLFQYALGRLVAEHRELALAVSCPSVAATDLCTLADHFRRAPLKIPGKQISDPMRRFALMADGEWTGQTLDLAELLHDTRPCGILLRGFFQQYRYFQNHETTLRSWFEISNHTLPFQPANNDIVVNIRRGIDYALRDWCLPMSFYTSLLEELGTTGRVIVCGTGIDERVYQSLSQFRPTYVVSNHPLDDFALMKAARRLVLSNSTYAWWAGYLSDAEQIWGPGTTARDFYAFRGFHDVSLEMGSRYTSRDVTGSDEFAYIDTRAFKIITLDDGMLCCSHVSGQTRCWRQVVDLTECLAALQSQPLVLLRDLRRICISQPQLWQFYGALDALGILEHTRVIDADSIDEGGLRTDRTGTTAS